MVTEAQCDSLRQRVAELRGAGLIGEERIDLAQLDDLIADYIADEDSGAAVERLLILVKLSNAFPADDTFARQLRRKWDGIFD